MGIFVFFQNPSLARGFDTSSAGTSITDVLEKAFHSGDNTVDAHIYPIDPHTEITSVQFKIDAGAFGPPTSWANCVAQITVIGLGTHADRTMHTLTIRVVVIDASSTPSTIDVTVPFYWRGAFTCGTGTGTSMAKLTSKATAAPKKVKKK
ncbi:MAG: hypothetical protein L0Z62_04650 [Gemmataceae bacterium]|nr:hypothetical protein [Gemmataceae bacterium]